MFRGGMTTPTEVEREDRHESFIDCTHHPITSCGREDDLPLMAH